MNKSRSGFTVVELLVVIVVIGILAAITIVSYNGIQGKASDVAVKSDLHSIGVMIAIFDSENSRAPSRSIAEMPTEWAPLGIKVSKSAYSRGWMKAGTQGYNMVYCHDVSAASSDYVIVAESKSGRVFALQNGTVRDGVGPMDTHTVVCKNNGLDTGGMWLFDDGVWRSWIQS